MQYLKECWNYVRSMQILVLICSTVYFEFGLLRLNTSRSKLSPSNAKKQMWKHHPVRLFGRRGALHVPRLWDWSRSHGSSTNSHAWICPDTWFSYILWIFATINVCFWLAVLQFEEVKVALLFFAESFVFLVLGDWVSGVDWWRRRNPQLIPSSCFLAFPLLGNLVCPKPIWEHWHLSRQPGVVCKHIVNAVSCVASKKRLAREKIDPADDSSYLKKS